MNKNTFLFKVFIVAVMALAAVVAFILFSPPHGPAVKARAEPLRRDMTQQPLESAKNASVRSQEALQKSPDRIQMAMHTPRSPEDILRAQENMLRRYGSMKRRGTNDDDISKQVLFEQGRYKDMGYPSGAMQLETARKAVVADLRKRAASGTSRVARNIIASECAAFGISPDDVWEAANPELDEKVEAAVKALGMAQDDAAARRILDSLKTLNLSNAGVALLAGTVQQVKPLAADAVLDFLAAYRDRKSCTELLDAVCRADDMALIRHALETLGNSPAEGTDMVLCDLLLRKAIPEDVRLPAIRCLTEWSAKENDAAVLAAELSKDGVAWQAHVLEQLGQFDLGLSAPLLLDAVAAQARMGDDTIARAALVALGRTTGYRHGQVVALCTDIAQDERRSLDVRLLALNEIPLMVMEHYEKVSAVVKGLAESRDPGIRQAAVAIMEKLHARAKEQTPEAQRAGSITRVQELLGQYQAARARLATHTDPESRRQLEELDRQIAVFKAVLEIGELQATRAKLATQTDPESRHRLEELDRHVAELKAMLDKSARNSEAPSSAPTMP